MLTASADQTVKLWDVEYGKMLYTFKFKGCVLRARARAGSYMPRGHALAARRRRWCVFTPSPPRAGP